MKRILVALDGTHNASFVLARAIELGKALDAKLLLLSAVQMPTVATATPTGPVYLDPAVLTVGAETMLRDCQARVPEALRGGTVAHIGIPSEVICAAARSYDADLVVIGAHRHGSLARALGTTAASIVNHIDRPVIVVKPGPDELEASGPAAGASGMEHTIKHPMTDVGALAGATAGAIVGVAGGPPGAILGGLIGGGIGLLAGRVLDEEGSRTSKHDRELDADIGVTRGDLGAREPAIVGLDAVESARRSGTDFVAAGSGPALAGAILRRDHERLERTYDDFVAAYRSGDWEQVQHEWARFEPAIRAHMDREEHDVLAELRAVDPEEADALLADHAELRRLLATLGVAIDLHAVPAADAQELISRLRAHGAREEVLLYPWMDRELDATTFRRRRSAGGAEAAP